jgi:hypothetical protein
MGQVAVIPVMALAAIGLAATLPAYAEDAKPVPKPNTETASGPVNANASPSDGLTVPNASDRHAADAVRAEDNWDETRARLRDAQAKLDALSNEANAAQAKIKALLKHFADDGTTSTQPLTRADCEKAGLAWDDGNVCDWQAEGPKDVETTPEITAAIPSGQPLTRASCNKAGMVWNDRANVCGLGPNETTTTQSSISSKIASKPQGTAKRITKIEDHANSKIASKPQGTAKRTMKIEDHAKRKNTSLRRPPMGLVGWDPMKLHFPKEHP